MTGTMTTPATTIPAELTAADRCDRCGAAAAVRVTVASGSALLFCGHHANEHATRIEQIATSVQDERASN